MRALYWFFCSLLLAGSALAGFSETADKVTPPPDFAELLEDAEISAVYEGLPHQMFEGALLDSEKAAKKTFTRSGEFFYERVLVISASDLTALDQSFRSNTLCRPYRGMKPCGGFHADYMIEWKRNNQHMLSALVCFGCGEIRVIVGDSVIMTDMTSDAYSKLRERLAKYRQERPLGSTPAKLKRVTAGFSPPKVEAPAASTPIEIPAPMFEAPVLPSLETHKSTAPQPAPRPTPKLRRPQRH